MFGGFERPIGAVADMRELEYVSVLHQTALPDVRSDATVSGVVLSHDDAMRLARGLGARDASKQKDDETALRNHRNEIASMSPLHKIRKFSRSKTTSSLQHQNVDAMDAATSKGEGSDLFHDSANDEDVDEEGSYDACNEQGGVYLDVVQIVSLLMIPNLLDARDEMLDFSPKKSQNSNTRAKVFTGCNDKDDANSSSPSTDDNRSNINIFAICASALQSSAKSLDHHCHQPPVLTVELLRKVLESLDEHDIINNDALMQRMVDSVSSCTDNVVYLDEMTLARALTSDVTEKWRRMEKDNPTTSFQDAFGCTLSEAKKCSPPLYCRLNARIGEDAAVANCVQDMEAGTTPSSASDNNDADCDEERGVKSSPTDEHDPSSATPSMCKISDGSNYSKQQLHLLFTFSSIDYVADTYRSNTYLVLLWCFYITSVLSYVSLILSSLSINPICESVRSFGCKLMETLWVWLSFAIMLSFAGLIIVIPISIGNQPDLMNSSWHPLLFSMLMLVIYSVVPFVIFLYHPPQVLNEVKSYQPYYYYLLIHANFGIGCLLFALQLYHPISLFLHNHMYVQTRIFVDNNPRRMQRIFTPSDVRAEMNVKLASQHKMDLMIRNACDLHSKNNEETMRNFLIRGESYVHCGGFLWTWYGLWNQSLFAKEGVWIQSRLIVGQMAQVIVAVIFEMLLFLVTDYTARAANDARQDVVNDPFSSVSKDWALWLLPRSDMILISSHVGLGVSLCVSVVLILLYIPSTVGTILKLRSGVIPTLHDARLMKFRSSADTMFYNLGNMIYALVGSACLFWLFFGGLIFLFLWPVSQDVMVLVLAWFIGLMLTITLKWILVKLCRIKFYKAMYRRKPASANVAALTLEAWQIGIGGGVLLGRLTQFLLAAAFWIGRIDAFFLADDVNLFGYNFDTTPINYRKEILAHEAHRHPFIDRLGTLYLMKLRHGDQFVSDVGTAWRRVLVLAVFPWLAKYKMSRGSST